MAAAAIGTLALVGGAARADVQFDGISTIITSGIKSGSGAIAGAPAAPEGYTAGLFNTGGANGYGITFSYGVYNGTTFVPSNPNLPNRDLDPNITGPDFQATGTARNVLPATGVPGEPYFYDRLPGTSWVSAYADTTTAMDFGGVSQIGEAQDFGPSIAFDETFRYDVTFNLNPSGGTPVGFTGEILSDDIVEDVWLDFGTAQATKLGLVLLNPLPSASGPLYFRYGINGNASTFFGTGSGTPLTGRTLSFFVENDFNRRTALDFRVIAQVPEPGAVAFGVIMGGGLLGLVLRSRRRGGKDQQQTPSAA